LASPYCASALPGFFATICRKASSRDGVIGTVSS
jgi:hypothetical protein